MVRARRHTIAEYLSLAAEYGREQTNGVLADVVNRLSFVDDYLTAPPVRARRLA